jgi:hypothetical protein
MKNERRPKRFLRKLIARILLVSGLGLAVPRLPAAPAQTSGDFLAGLALLRQGDDAGAIARLTAHLRWDRSSPGYEYNLGGRLAAAAFMLHDGGRIAAAQRVARLALAHLDVSRLGLAGAPATVLAQADASSGMLYELILGDLNAAQSCYERAIQRDAHRPSAKAGLARVQALQAANNR